MWMACEYFFGGGCTALLDWLCFILRIQKDNHGPNQEYLEEGHRPQGLAQATGRQQCRTPREAAERRGGQEAAPLPPGHGGAPRNPPLPEVDGDADTQAALPAAGAGDRAAVQDGPALPVGGHSRAAGGVGGAPGRLVRGRQPVRHARQARHGDAAGHSAGSPHPWRAGGG
jgi:hypothetical protein